MKQDTLVILLQKWEDVFMSNSMQSILTFARQNNLSMSQMGTLTRLQRDGTSGVSEMSEELGISNAAVSQMLERLVQQGLIHRTEAAHDRRAKVIELTEKGRQMVSEGLYVRQQWFSNLAASLSAEETQKAAEGMNILINKVTNMDNFNEEKRKSRVCCD
ncbi:MAG: MarR family transcriptional regulator [Chloroflexi bacterium]|nr:MarR family transcriptional regulator [Chloroflexota bacterium]